MKNAAKNPSDAGSELASFRAIVATDLDGTLLCSKGLCSELNRQVLRNLESIPVLRVVATGRSLYSVRKTLEGDFPIDLLVFSSGAGIWDWKTQQVLHHVLMTRADAMQVADTLRSNGLSFMAHAPIPDNHRFWYFENTGAPPEFERRVTMHGELAERWSGDFPQVGITQFIVMTATQGAAEQLALLRKLLPNQSIVRATSPWNPEITWLEIFPSSISKGHALRWVQAQMQLASKPTFALGNDYNDIELLDWAERSHVVGNAPKDLLEKYKPVADNESDGFYHAVTDWLVSNSLRAPARTSDFE